MNKKVSFHLGQDRPATEFVKKKESTGEEKEKMDFKQEKEKQVSIQSKSENQKAGQDKSYCDQDKGRKHCD